MEMKDLAYAARLRDIVRKICTRQIDKMRPRPSVAQVKVIDRVNLACDVRYPNDTANVTVKMGSVQPSAVNQYVRIEGPPGDRFITAVLGAAFYA